MFDYTGLDLNVIWFVLLGVLFMGYAILDGFDLGVGALHLFTSTDKERRLMINSIGPVWDGNEVWLVTGGGAFFAAFPEAYATLTSGFYFAVMLFLLSLIFRAVAIEFRSKVVHSWWRKMWDVSFSLSSIMTSFILGVVLGNLIQGIPLDEHSEYMGTFSDILNPYALLVGVMIVALFMMHGAIYVVMKTEGEFHDKIRGWVNNCIIFFIMCYATTTMATLVFLPHMIETLKTQPTLFILPVLNMLAIANIPRCIQRNQDFFAFLSSCFAIISLMVLFGIGVFPNVILSNPVVENSLTIYTAASSQKALGILLNIAILGIPIVLSYTVCIYWVFRGKVKLTEESY